MILSDLSAKKAQLSSTAQELETRKQARKRLLMQMSSLEYQSDLANVCTSLELRCRGTYPFPLKILTRRTESLQRFKRKPAVARRPLG